jgi:hypothetical protein
MASTGLVPFPFVGMFAVVVVVLPLLIIVVVDLNFFGLGKSNASLVRRQSLSLSRTI